MVRSQLHFYFNNIYKKVRSRYCPEDTNFNQEKHETTSTTHVNLKNNNNSFLHSIVTVFLYIPGNIDFLVKVPSEVKHGHIKHTPPSIHPL